MAITHSAAGNGLFGRNGERKVSVCRRIWFRKGAYSKLPDDRHQREPFGASPIKPTNCDYFFRKLSRVGQSKIYGKPNHSNFLQFERIVQTRDLSAPATAAREDCEIKSQRGENSTTGGEMFFLLRMAFWLGLVLVLLPTDKSQDMDKTATPQVGAADAISAATAAVSDMTQFCTRQPGACAVGGQAATVIGHRAQAGAKKLYNMITDKRPPDHTGSVGSVESLRAASGDTLTPADLQVEWRAPAATTTSSQRRG